MDTFLQFQSDSSDDDLEVMAQMLTQAQAMLTTAADEESPHACQGSRPGKRPNIDRFALEGAERLYKDYFSDNPVYTDEQFRRRFRMRRNLFVKIVEDLEKENKYFVQKPDATGKWGLTSLQKCTAAIRQLAYGISADAVDEYVRMAESTARESMLEFCRTIIKVYGTEYLRYPNKEDVRKLNQIGEKRGFPGMLGSLDCCHWEWKNCPTAWAGQYKGKEKKPTIVLEAVASYDLWIWHAFFGMPGSNNDINVLDRSPLFSDLYSGRAPPVEFTINERAYDTGYFLADGIYPPLSTLVQTISAPIGKKRKLYAQMQEAARKDVERAFGVLLARFAIIKIPGRLWNKEDLASIIRACIILHNKIIEDESNDDDPLDLPDQHAHDVPVVMGTESDFNSFIARYQQVHDAALHRQLQEDLVQHLWNIKAKKINHLSSTNKTHIKYNE